MMTRWPVPERAVAAWSSTSSPEPELTELELELAEALVLVGQGERSRALCKVLAERARARGDTLRFGRAALAYGAEIRVGVSDPTQVALLVEAERGLGDGELALKAQVMARLAAAVYDNEPAQALALAHSAISLARSTGERTALLQALHMGGAAIVCFGSLPERREAARELAKLAVEENDLVLAQRGYQRWAIDAAELGDREEMEEALRAEARIATVLGHARFRWKGALLGSMRALAEEQQRDPFVSALAGWTKTMSKTFSELMTM